MFADLEPTRLFAGLVLAPGVLLSTGRDECHDIVAVPQLPRGLGVLPGFRISELDRIEEAASTATMLDPLGGRYLELAALLLIDPVAPDPVRQRRPCRDHHLVSEIDQWFSTAIVLVHREQAV